MAQNDYTTVVSTRDVDSLFVDVIGVDSRSYTGANPAKNKTEVVKITDAFIPGNWFYFNDPVLGDKQNEFGFN